MLPDPLFQIKSEKETADSGLFIFEPLERGYGHTVGSAMRRVLLTSLNGAAVTQVKIDGVRHKFSTLKGLKEDIVELILNIKKLRVRYTGEKPVKITIDKTGPAKVTAADIECPASVEIINKDFVLANLADKKSRLKVEMVVESGRGYSPAEEREGSKIGAMTIDAVFSPVLAVNYSVEATRVGHRTDLDRLILEVKTDGGVSPGEAVKKGAEILIGYFAQIFDPKIVESKPVKPQKIGDGLNLTIEEIGLPTRVVNALRQAGYGMVDNLTTGDADQLAKVKNLGEKSIELVREALKARGFDLPAKK